MTRTRDQVIADCFRTGEVQFEDDLAGSIESDRSAYPTFTKWMIVTLISRIILIIFLAALAIRDC